MFMGMGYDPSASSAFTMGYSGFSFGRGSGFFNVRPDALAANPNPSLRFLTQNVQRMLITNVGNVGIGTFGPLSTDPWPTNSLHVRLPNGSPNVPLKLETSDADSITGLSLKNDARNWHIRVDGSDADKFKIWDSTANAFRVTIQADGKVGIGTTTPSEMFEVNGTIKATKVIGAVYQDFAEWVPASVDMTPGTVVVLNVSKTNEVSPSSTPYDTTVAGVVSAAPGILLGEESASKEMIATTGRVKVRVDATRAPIRVGDLLVTSDVSGAAMRSEPMDISGRHFHQPGTIIGKALEPLDDGVGEILVLLSLQ
jgi:hypothetical protein